VPTCPACGKELPGEFPFCPFCAAPLTEQAPSVQEERKVVTVLFCDLVGFTADSEAADPEDVRARIRPYHAQLRHELELYGGTVEKFIGDAVMAVFGAPVAHEDDAERAVRAALRVLDAIEELNAEDATLALQVRVGINTGEAVVTLDARPEEGEGIVTGDVVNTASRLQGAAPVNGIAVSEATYRATERVFDWEPLQPVQVKGKGKPLSLWRPLVPRARFGSDVTRSHSTPLVGRDLEKPLLIGTFERSAQQRSCQLVTIVGEPGVGKSRLCAELFAYLDERPGLTRWRQGRCLSYGEGIAFWALGEIVKAECGILETDSPEEAEAKLKRALPADDPDRAWLQARLAPLVGAPAEPASQEESFTAWRRFCEGLGADGPAVLVFEDLHWADPALLGFLEHLADWAEGVPLLLLCTARPELHERHPGWAGGLRNATTINLAPLSDQETAQLVSALLERAVLPAEIQQALLERAGGNPLYAEEFVRLLTDRGVSEDSAAVPESVQALIAARLDTITAERKSLLQDAAVIGKVFWAGALAEMGDRDAREVEQALHELARKELVRPSRSSSMQGDAEYGFWHLLVRDVCYQQIPRADRAARHRMAASWLERKAGDRVEDLADVLAHHSLQALELTRAAGQTDQAAELEAPALRFLMLAGERALNLDTVSARTSLRRALELAPQGHPARARILALLARSEELSGGLSEAVRLYEEAIAAYSAAGDEARADEATLELSIAVLNAGDVARSESLLDGMLGRLEDQGPSELLARVYCSKQYHHQDDLTWAERALAITEQLDLPAVRIRALNMRGLARAASFGDPRGIADLRASLALALEEQATREANVAYVNLAGSLALVNPAAALEVADEGIGFASTRGLSPNVRVIRQWALLRLGRWDELLDAGREILSVVEPLGDRWAVGHSAAPMALALTRRGATEAAVELARTSSSEVTKELFSVPPIVAHRIGGALAEAEQLLESAVQVWVSEGKVPAWNFDFCDLARETTALRRPDLLESLLALAAGDQGGAIDTRTTWLAIAAEAAGRYDEALGLFRDAEQRWRESGDPYERAHALLGQTRCLIAVERPNEAVRPLSEARDLFAQLGAVPALAETQALLGETEAAAV
jgi:class 3 adenylate cyclase/tetratricopeptide (TPR) repeat protein